MMAITTYIPGTDYWEIFRLAGGDNSVSTHDSATGLISNQSVTQVALDQAIVDHAAGVKSSQAMLESNLIAEESISTSQLALAILGDSPSITALQTLVGSTTPAFVPTASPSSSPKFRYIGSTVGTPASTLFTNIPFLDSIDIPPNGFTNAAGLITVANTGNYTISVTLPYLTTIKYQLQQIRVLHNLLPVGPISKQEAGKITFNGTLNISGFPIHLVSGDTISIQYLGTIGTTYSSYLHIEELGA